MVKKRPKKNPEAVGKAKEDGQVASSYLRNLFVLSTLLVGFLLVTLACCRSLSTLLLEWSAAAALFW